jgi:uncharacterized membrane protein
VNPTTLPCISSRRKRPTRIAFAFLTAVLATLALAAVAPAQDGYTIRRLTAPGLAHGAAHGIDNHGRIVGELLDTAGAPHAVLWRDGVAMVLPPLLAGGSGAALAINDDGVLGGSAANVMSPGSATVWMPAGGSWTPVDLGVGGAGYLFANVLAVGGLTTAVGFVDDGFVTQPAAWSLPATTPGFVPLPLPPWAIGGEATGVLGASLVFGTVGDWGARAPAQWDLAGWMQSAGAPTLSMLPTLGSGGGVLGAHANGRAVGWVSAPGGFDHLAAWQNGVLSDLGHLPGTDAYATATNAGGDVVGWARTYASPPFVAVHKPAGQPVVYLNQKLPPQSGWSLARAYGIDDRGQIVGVGTKNGFFEPFVMTPTRVRLDVPTPGNAGGNNDFVVHGAPPSTDVFFCVGLSGGETVLPGCAEVLNLDAPLVFGVVAADAAGNAALTVAVPGFLAGLPLVFQAYVPAECAASNVFVHSF